MIVSYQNNKEDMIMFALIGFMFKLFFWLAFLPIQIMLLPLTILEGGSKSKSSDRRRYDSHADDLFMSGVVMNEFLDDLEEDDWWRD